MVRIVGIQFQKNGKVYDYDTNHLEVQPGDYVIAETQRGTDLGQVFSRPVQTDEKETDEPLKKLIRIATEQDLQRSTENREKEKEAYRICQEKIAEHQLDMKLVSVEYAFDNSKAIFYFTANGRVDFRSLVKDLASIFRMRIELRQIGVRDEARMLGGLGPCGRPICCRAFLDEFQPVSIKMAKEQNLSLNPTKISGVCGRLMCCLKYEQDHYEQTRKIMPRIGKEVITPDGNGTVTDLNIVKETVFVRIANGDANEIKEYPLGMIEKVQAPAYTHDEPPRAVQDSEEGEDPSSADKAADKNPADETQEKNRTLRPAKRNKGGYQMKQKETKKAEKSDISKKEHQLGKPVMRENPNRPAANTAAAEQKEEKVTSWADAVQKAMDSIR